MKGFEYFKSTNGPKSCSMILFSKAEQGESFLRSFIRKYFKDEDSKILLEKDDKELVEKVQQIQQSIEENYYGNNFYI